MRFNRRPPPLQLDATSFFNTTAAPLESPPKTSFITKVYRLNWRMLIVAVAALNAVRFLFSAVQDFQDASIDNTHGFPRLARLSVALGVMYTIACIIDVYGAFSASYQRFSLIRIYTFLTCVSAMLVTVCGMSSTFRYFMLAEDVLNECSVLTMAGIGSTKSTFRGAEWPLGAASSTDDAASKCVNAWTKSSTSQITIDFLLFHILPAIFQVFIVCVYYGQVRNPEHAASLHNGVNSNNNGNNNYRAVRLEASTRPSTSHSPLYASASTAGFGHTADRANTRFNGRTNRTPRGGGAMQNILKKTMQQQSTNGKTNMNTLSVNNVNTQAAVMTLKPQAQRASFANAWLANPNPVATVPVPNPAMAYVQGVALTPTSAAVAPGPPSFSVRQDAYGGFHADAVEETQSGFNQAAFQWERR